MTKECFEGCKNGRGVEIANLFWVVSESYEEDGGEE